MKTRAARFTNEETGSPPAEANIDLRGLLREVRRRALLALAGQVQAMWHWARDLDAQDALEHEFAIPPGLRVGSPDDVAVSEEEGWILCCPSP